VLVDRDGVVNRDSAEYVKSVAEWQALPGSLEAIARLTDAGFRVVVVTNQSGVGRGLFSAATLAEIHAAMLAAAEARGGRIAGVFHCPHRPDEGCDCRKPKPGLLNQVAAAFGVDLKGVPFIGDKLSDVAAGRAVGARPILVGTRVPVADAPGIERYADLAAAASALIAEAEVRQ
jgi:D-glycero-D-manno-heptose 1,7-bisphosphate phosphatase